MRREPHHLHRAEQLHCAAPRPLDALLTADRTEQVALVLIELERLYEFIDCTDGRPDGYRYVRVNVDPAVVRGRARDNVSRLVPRPALDINPPPAGGTYMNVGNWLAITPLAPVTATALAGFVRADATATYTHMDWDMGNGDTFSCDGAGTPIGDVYPDRGDAPLDEQGPCGCTYRWPDVRGEKTVTVTAHWAVTYSDSTGASGSLDPLETSTTFDYLVYELQTVGVDN